MPKMSWTSPNKSLTNTPAAGSLGLMAVFKSWRWPSRYTRYEKLITVVILVVLFYHLFYPEQINIDKFTMMLLGFLVLVAILPSVQSAKFPYVMEIKRKLDRVKKATEAMDGRDQRQVYTALAQLIRVQQEALADGRLGQQEIVKLNALAEKTLAKLEKKKA